MINMKQFGELELCTHCIFRPSSFFFFLFFFDLRLVWPQDLLYTWKQYCKIDPFLRTVGLTPDLFSQLVGGTFSEWWVDSRLVERLFQIADEKQDGILDFAELVKLLSGTPNFLFTFFSLNFMKKN